MEHNVIYSGNTRYKLYSGSSRMGVAKESVAPTYDAEIEYLESTGTQYIEIPCSVSAGTYFAVGGHLIHINKTGVNGIFGVEPSFNQFCATRYNATVFATTVGGNASSGGMTFSYDIKHSFELSTLGKTIDNTFSSLPRALTSSISKFILFKRRTSENGYPIKFCNIYIKVGDNIVFDGIPVRVGQVGYLYDKVSGQLFGNAGTGDFILGNDIN